VASAHLQEMEILVVDDEEANRRLLERLLAKAGYRRTVLSSRADDVFGACVAGQPQLILLDLHMPGVDGFEVLRRLRSLDRAVNRPPVIVLTADISPAAKRQALDLGANDFVSKPFDAAEVILRVRNLLYTRHLQLQLERRKKGLEQLVRERTADLEQARLEVLDRLALAAEYRDDDTQEHALRIGWRAEQLARELGVDDAIASEIGRAAPLHDVGKIGVPDAILLKSGPLTDAEYGEMKRHAEIGGEMLSGGRAALLQMAEEIARTHHERWDGTGYPRGLAGDEIPLAGRIVAVVDVFDALTHRRPYKEPWPVERAAEEIRQQSARQFDPRVVDAFNRLDHAALAEHDEGERRVLAHDRLTLSTSAPKETLLEP
jgi:putative two-component system response regulator